MSTRSFLEKNADREADLQELLPFSMPLGLCIEPTNHCNMKCRFCPVHLPEFVDVVGGLRFIDLSLYRKIIDDIAEMGGQLNNLQLYGDGEPFLNKNLPEMIRIAADRKVAKNIIVTTNGSAITPKTAAALLDSGLTHLHVSIYGIDTDFHRHSIGSNVAPRKIHENIRIMREMRDARGNHTPWIYVKMIGAPEMQSQLEEFTQLYTGIADEVNIENPINWNGYNNIDLVGAIDPQHQVDLACLQGWHRNKGAANHHKRVCTTPFLSLNIKADGTVVICIVDWNKGTAVGDIKKESLSEIWHGERLRNFRRLHMEGRRDENPSCRNCKVLYNSPENIDALADSRPEWIFGTIGRCQN